MDKSLPTIQNSSTRSRNNHVTDPERALTPQNSLTSLAIDLSLHGASYQPGSSIENRKILESNQEKLMNYQYLCEKIQGKINNSIMTSGKIERGLRETIAEHNPKYIRAEQILDSFFMVINHIDINENTLFSDNTHISMDALIDILIDKYFDIRGDDLHKGIDKITKGEILDTQPMYPFRQTYHRRWCERTLDDLLVFIDVKKALITLIDKTSHCKKNEVIDKIQTDSDQNMALEYNRADSWDTFNIQNPQIHKDKEHWELIIRLKQSSFYPAPRSDNPDAAMCFSCRLSLANWAKNDNPYFEHALYEKNCLALKKLYTNRSIMAVNQWDKTTTPAPMLLTRTEEIKNRVNFLLIL